MSCRDPDPTPAPRGAHSYHSCLATPPFRPCRTGGPFSDTKTGPRTRIPGRLLVVLAEPAAAPVELDGAMDVDDNTTSPALCPAQPPIGPPEPSDGADGEWVRGRTRSGYGG